MVAMASVAATLPSLYSSSSSISRRSSRLENSLPSCSSFSFLPRRNNGGGGGAHLMTVKRKKYNFHTRVNAAIEEETGTTTTLVPPEEDGGAEAVDSIPVSRSDILFVDIKAEGTLKDSDAPKVLTALEKIEGVSGVDVHVEGNVATIVLTKQTSFLDKPVASELVEAMQGAGFKLNALNLGFWDGEEDNV